jgi:4-aminobutyrate aminotransferase/(S)-3-amino-2-methylpropionate transaminase
VAPSPDRAVTVACAAEAHRRGLVLLTAGTWGNVLRLLPPLVIGEQLLTEGLDVLDEVFADIARRRHHS